MAAGGCLALLAEVLAPEGGASAACREACAWALSNLACCADVRAQLRCGAGQTALGVALHGGWAWQKGQQQSPWTHPPTCTAPARPLPRACLLQPGPARAGCLDWRPSGPSARPQRLWGPGCGPGSQESVGRALEQHQGECGRGGVE